MKFLLVNYMVELFIIILIVINNMLWRKLRFNKFLEEEGLYFLKYKISKEELFDDALIKIILFGLPVIGCLICILVLISNLLMYKVNLDIDYIYNYKSNKFCKFGFIEDLEEDTLDYKFYTKKSIEITKKVLQMYTDGYEFNNFNYRSEDIDKVSEINNTTMYKLNNGEYVALFIDDSKKSSTVIKYFLEMKSNILSISVTSNSHSRVNKLELTIFDKSGYKEFEFIIYNHYPGELNQEIKLYSYEISSNKGYIDTNLKLYLKKAKGFETISNSNEKGLFLTFDKSTDEIPYFMSNIGYMYLDEENNKQEVNFDNCFDLVLNKYINVFKENLDTLMHIIRYNKEFRNLKIMDNSLINYYLNEVLLYDEDLD